MKESKILIGAHVSSAGGRESALERADALGIKCLQMFGSSPKQYNAEVPNKQDASAFKEARKEFGVKKVFLHAPYLINLASVKPFVRHKSKEALALQLEIADALGANGVVFHIGSVGRDGSPKEGIEKVIKNMNKILAERDGGASLIIENGSGGGGKIGATIDEIATILEGIEKGDVGVCLDTAHIFAAGELDFTNRKVKSFFKEWDEKITPDALRVIHANDSKAEYGSFVDRHENIGHGHIGLEGFKFLANEKTAARVPWILEVPGFLGEGPDKQNIDILNKIVA